MFWQNLYCGNICPCLQRLKEYWPGERTPLNDGSCPYNVQYIQLISWEILRTLPGIPAGRTRCSPWDHGTSLQADTQQTLKEYFV